MQAIYDQLHIQVLVLYVDRASCGIYCRAVLIEVRLLTTGNIKPSSMRGGVTIAIACRMDGPLNLYNGAAAPPGYSYRKLQISLTF